MSKIAELASKVLISKFGGKLGVKVQDFESEEEMKFEKKHLKAYLRGDELFTFGFVTDKYGNRLKKWHVVKYIYE